MLSIPSSSSSSHLEAGPPNPRSADLQAFLPHRAVHQRRHR
jgi:hypothetical protein